MTEKIPLSVFIITLNEADRVPVAIGSVRDWVDEVVVVDSGSADETVAVCEALGATVVHHDWSGYGAQKVYGESLCRHRWILNIDADEEISDELAAEIRALFATGLPVAPAYRLRILPLYNFQRRAHRLTVNNEPIRLYDREAAGFKDSAVHDSVVLGKGKTPILHGLVAHRSFRSLTHHLDKVNSYSSAQSQDLFDKNRNPSVLELLLVPVFAFFKMYVLRRGFLNGIDGVVIAHMYAFQRFIRLAKTRERFQLARKAQDE